MAASDSTPIDEVSQSASDLPLSEATHSTAPDVLAAAASDPGLGEELALALLKRIDLPAEALARLSKNGSVIKQRKVKLALVEHAKTPRHVSIPLLRQLFTFDLMRVALTPAVAADIKMIADEVLINRLETIPSGERLSLARRASGRVASALLLDSEQRVVCAALDNPRLTEAAIIRTLMQRDAPSSFVEAVCHHATWGLRREVRVALLRNENTPLARALEYARSLPASVVCEILDNSNLSENIKSGLLKVTEEQSGVNEG